jgi:hypothetical protein
MGPICMPSFIAVQVGCVGFSRNDPFGYNEISTKAIETSPIILVFLYVISVTNHSLKGLSQNNLNIQKLSLCIKKGKKSCISNYRPISLLISFSKIFKNVMYKGVTLTNSILTE